MIRPTDIELWEAFGAGVYLLFGVIHLDLWLRRRDRAAHLWLACASFSALVVDLTGLAGGRLASPPAVLGVLNLGGVAAAAASLFELVSSLDRTPAGRLARGGQLALLVLAVLAGSAFPTLFAAFAVACAALLFWSMARALRAARNGDHESGVIARGFAVLIVCLVADVARELHLLPLPGGLPILGFIVLFLTAARSLNDRFGREEEASRTDTMTGLPNRRGFLEAGDGALVRGRRSGRPVAVILADLDRLKPVNDTHGHAAGDAALRAVATAIRASLRAQDTAARWGGDEFIVLLPDTAREGAVHVAESLRSAVAGLAIGHGGAAISLTLSLGVAEHRPGRNFEDTIAEADAALYEAKERGRDRVVAR